jgi:hypothetical protein
MLDKGLYIMTTINLVQLRNNVAEAVGRQYGAVKKYAEGLNALAVEGKFPAKWYDIDRSDASENGKVVKAEKSEFYKPMKAQGHSNPSTVWARVQAEGKANAKAQGLFGEVASVEGEGEDEGSGATHARSPMLRNIEELTALWKFNGKQTGLDPKIVKAQQKISEALQALGVDLNMINA